MRKLPAGLVIVWSGFSGVANASDEPPLITLDIWQPKPVPVLDGRTDATLELMINGDCDGNEGQVAAMLGDTMSDWLPLAGEDQRFVFSVPQDQQPFVRSLCSRYKGADAAAENETAPGATELMPLDVEGGFTAQVFGRCRLDDGAMVHHTQSMAMRVMIQCAAPDNTESPDNVAPADE